MSLEGNMWGWSANVDDNPFSEEENLYDNSKYPLDMSLSLIVMLSNLDTTGFSRSIAAQPNDESSAFTGTCCITPLPTGGSFMPFSAKPAPEDYLHANQHNALYRPEDHIPQVPFVPVVAQWQDPTSTWDQGYVTP
jgi:hypothetical protein